MEDGSDEEKAILYDVLPLHEWVQDPELASKISAPFGYPDSRSGFLNSIVNLAGGAVVPDSVARLINGKSPWFFCLSPSVGGPLAVLQNNHLEILAGAGKEPYSSAGRKRPLAVDVYPQWRRMSWNEDASLLAIAYSSGVIEVCETSGATLFTIEPQSATPTVLAGKADDSLMAAGIFFSSIHTRGTEWSAELIVVDYRARIQGYFVSPTLGFERGTDADLSGVFPRGITSVEFSHFHGLLIISGARVSAPKTPTSPDGDSVQDDNLLALRLVSEYPYYKIVSDSSISNSGAGEQWSASSRTLLQRLSSFMYSSGPADPIVQLSAAPKNGRNLAGIHASGRISVWSLPGLKLSKSWALEEQPGFDFEERKGLALTEDTSNVAAGGSRRVDVSYRFYPCDIQWWNDSCLIVTRYSGAVTVNSVEDGKFRNMLGENPELFFGAPKLSSAPDPNASPDDDSVCPGFIALECETKWLSRRARARSSSGHSASELEEDNDVDLDEEEELKSSWVQWAKKGLYFVLYWATDNDSLLPPRRKPLFCVKTFRLVGIQSTSPEELYQRKMETGEYGDALSLAKIYNLDTDAVYQKQWRSAPVTGVSIQDYLRKIKKRAWVLRECMERVPKDIDAVYELLNYGLKQTDFQVLLRIGKGEDDQLVHQGDDLSDDEDDDSYYNEEAQARKARMDKKKQTLLDEVDWSNLNLAQIQLIEQRKTLLQYLERLTLCEKMLELMPIKERNFDAKFYGKFRKAGVLEATLEFAHTCNFNGIDVMWTFCGKDTLPHRLMTLSHIPETVYPYYYRALLPECTPDGFEMLEWPEEELRKPDWCELRPVQSLEGAPKQERSDLTPEELTNWVKGRAVEIDSRSRLVENAVNFLKLCNENCIPGLEELLEDFMVFDMIVYEAAPMSFMEKDLTFQGFSKLTDIQKIELMMSESKEDAFVANMTNWLKYFFAPNGREKRNSDVKFDVIREFALKLCAEDVSKARKVLDACRKDRTHTIPDSDRFASLVIECMYACQRWEDLPAIFGMGECLHALATGTGSQSSGFAPLGAQMRREAARAEDDLKVAEITTELGSPMVPKSVADLREDVEGVAFLFTRLCRLAVSRRPPLTKSDWFTLLKQLHEVRDLAFANVIATSRVTEIWIKSLLVAGNEELIKIAGNRLRSRPDASLSTTSLILTSEDGRLTYEDSVQLCLEAGREYVDACASATGKNVALAAVCYKLVAPGGSTQIANELKLLEALPLLAAYGVQLLPVQVRLKKDRVELVRDVLKCDASAYSKPQSILDLALLLSPPDKAGEERKIRGRVFNILAEKAFQLRDFSVCTDLCEKIVSEGHADGWEVCGKFGTALADSEVDTARTPDLRSRLLSFAMAHCPGDKIHEYLETSLKIEVESEGGWKQAGSGEAATVSHSEAFAEGDGKWKKPLGMAAEGVKKLYDKMKVTNEDKFAYIDWFGVVRSPYGSDQKEKGEEEVGLDLAHAALRTALIDDWLGSGVCDRGYVRHALRKIGQSLITNDEVELGLYYFLSAKKVFDVPEEDEGIDDDDSGDIEDYFPVSQPVGDAMEAAQYFYARLANEKLGNFKKCADGKHLCREKVMSHRQKVVEIAISQLRQAATRSDFSPVAKKLLEKVAALRQEVDDREQAKILASVSDDIDAARFAADPVYKADTILGLAMTSDEAVLKVAEQFADKYGIPSCDIAVAHVQYLFAHHVHTTALEASPSAAAEENMSGDAGAAIKQRLQVLGYMSALQEQPESSLKRLRASVYEGIHGSDLKSLSAYHSLVAAMFPSGNGRAAVHAVFAKCLKELANLHCDIDFKAVQRAKTSKDLKLHLRPAIDSKTEKIIQKLAGCLEASNEDHEDPEHLVRGIVLAKTFLKKESSKAKSTEEWVRQFKTRLEQVLASGAKGPVLRHLFQEIAFSHAGVKMIPREARKQILEKTAHLLVAKGFFNAEDRLLADMKSYAAFLDSLDAGLSALDVELPASWIENFESACWQDDSMKDFFHILISKSKADLETVRAFVGCLEPDRIGGGLSELQMASFRRSVEEFLLPEADNDQQSSTSLAEAKSAIIACVANIAESWRAGEFFPGADELLECVEMALSTPGHLLDNRSQPGNGSKSLEAQLLRILEEELLRQPELDESAKTKLYKLWEQILGPETETSGQPGGDLDNQETGGFLFEQALKNAVSFPQLVSIVDLMLKKLRLIGKDELDDRAWQLAVERIVVDSASNDKQRHEALHLMRRLMDDGLDAWQCWPPEQRVEDFLKTSLDKVDELFDESNKWTVGLSMLFGIRSPYSKLQEKCIEKLKSATSPKTLPAKPTLVSIYNHLIKLNQIPSIYGTPAFAHFLDLAVDHPASEGESLSSLEDAFQQLKKAGLAPQAAFLAGRRHTAVPVQLRTFRASMAPKFDWNTTWNL